MTIWLKWTCPKFVILASHSDILRCLTSYLVIFSPAWWQTYILELRFLLLMRLKMAKEPTSQIVVTQTLKISFWILINNTNRISDNILLTSSGSHSSSLLNRRRGLSYVPCLGLGFWFLLKFFHSLSLLVAPFVLMALMPCLGWID